MHRPYNTDVPENLRAILQALADIDETIIFPVHPRTQGKIAELEGAVGAPERQGSVKMIPPVGYLDMLALEQHARLILTDSGGMQKEAFFFGVPCVTLRPETEWVETVRSGWNELAGADPHRIIRSARRRDWPEGPSPALFGDGRAADKIVSKLTEEL